MLSRREFLIRSGLAVAGSKCKTPKRDARLKDCSGCSGTIVGGQWTWAELKADQELSARFLREFSMVTPGTELKWRTLSPSPGEYRFTFADEMMRWAEAHRLRLRGHNLVWPDYGTPDWVMGRATRNNAKAMLEAHVRMVVRRYRGKIHSWDVVNEPLNIWDRRPDLLAAHPWAELIGPEYIDLAFHAAAEEDSDARLIWNQNYLESTDQGDQANRDALLVQLRRLKRNGVPIHGVGIESHLFADKPLAAKQLECFVGEVRALGLAIQITELDVIDTSLPADLRIRDAAVADVYARYLDLMLRIAQPEAIVFWTFSDRRNWLDWAAKSNSKYRRMDGLAHRPGLLDSDLRDKAAYDQVEQALCKQQLVPHGAFPSR